MTTFKKHGDARTMLGRTGNFDCQKEFSDQKGRKTWATMAKSLNSNVKCHYENFDLADGSWWHPTAINNFLFSFNLHCFYLCFCCSLKFDFSFKMSISKCCSVWSVALSTVGFCTAWMRQNQILVLPNRDLGFGMTTFLTSVVFNETKKLRRRKKYDGG